MGNNAKGEITYVWCVREECGCKSSSQTPMVSIVSTNSFDTKCFNWLNIANKKLYQSERKTLLYAG